MSRSCNHCSSGKAISITYSECVSIALGIQHAMRVPHIISVACLAGTYFSNYIIWDIILVNKLLNMECVLFLYNFCLENFLFQEKLMEKVLCMYVGLHVKLPGSEKINLLATDFFSNFSTLCI